MIKSIKNMIISIFIYMVAFPMFLICSLLILIINMLNKNLTHKALQGFSKIMMFSMGIYPKIHGTFPKDRQYIVMMNHSSFLDMFIYPLILKGKWTGITAAENFNYPILSHILKKMDAIPIKKTNKLGAIKTIQIAEKKLMSGYHIGFSPEGERTLNGRTLPFKKGGFFMALNTNTPILPVGVSGAFNAKPKNRWWIKPGQINVTIGTPIQITKFNENNIELLIQIVENEIIQLSGKNFKNQ